MEFGFGLTPYYTTYLIKKGNLSDPLSVYIVTVYHIRFATRTRL